MCVYSNSSWFLYTSSNEPMENCVAPGLDEFDVLLEVVLSLVRVCLLL